MSEFWQLPQVPSVTTGGTGAVPFAPQASWNGVTVAISGLDPNTSYVVTLGPEGFAEVRPRMQAPNIRHFQVRAKK